MNLHVFCLLFFWRSSLCERIKKTQRKRDREWPRKRHIRKNQCMQRKQYRRRRKILNYLLDKSAMWRHGLQCVSVCYRVRSSHSRLLFAQLFLVDNLIKLFIVDIYHVIKHATLCVYNNTHTRIYKLTEWHCFGALSCHFYFFIAWFSDFFF